MKIQLYSDCADLVRMREQAGDPRIAGWTTNPTLMRKAGVDHYRAFASRALEVARGRPVSLEVLADDFTGMEAQARALSALGKNAVIKIPVTDTRGRSSAALVADLAADGIPLNVTAVFTEAQVAEVGQALTAGTGLALVSVFAGRVADAGVDPAAHVKKCRAILRRACPRAQMLWASPRQVYDAVLAERAGCEVITMTPDLIAKLDLLGKDLVAFSRETVQMFVDDARAAGYAL